MTVQVSVAIPAKDEQGNIGHLIEEIHAALNERYTFEVVLTDDGSRDGTVAEALSTAESLGLSLQVVCHAHSCGQSTALHSAVRHSQGQWIATLDADGQNDPADIPAMLAQVELIDNPHFCIAGYRKNRKDTAWKRFQSRLANRVRQRLLHDGVPDSGCGLKVFPKATFMMLPYFDHMHRFLPALICRLQGQIVVHEVNHRDRQAGVSKYNAWNRAWVGISDTIGVMWLIRRAKHPQIRAVESR
ncbi:glycosyltransferase family 2 protein [Celerinatantimonas yamalensis]|uniref:Glycosyltransferase family 2 protein n=1 Tax=Celerinatantimonas yamalensis TaxID=559956 RepID=A0ABW9GCA6_9GAMM